MKGKSIPNHAGMYDLRTREQEKLKIIKGIIFLITDLRVVETKTKSGKWQNLQMEGQSTCTFSLLLSIPSHELTIIFCFVKWHSRDAMKRSKNGIFEGKHMFQIDFSFSYLKQLLFKKETGFPKGKWRVGIWRRNGKLHYLLIRR